MRIIVHTGVECTDDERLIKCLLKNADSFGQQGIQVPQPKIYRTLLKDTLNAMKNDAPGEDARDILIDTFLGDADADRMILSNAQFFGTWRTVIRDGELYNLAPDRVAHMRRLFPNDQFEIFMAIRNPATFLPAMFETANKGHFVEFLRGTDLRMVRWSETIKRIREAAPDVPLTVWCNEDTPLIWAQIIREMAGLEHGEKISGGFDLLAEIMSPEGMKRFRAYLKQQPEMSEMQKRRVIAAFLDKFALEDEVEEELDLPGWSEPLIEALTEIYDEDLFRIQRIPGVQLIAP